MIRTYLYLAELIRAVLYDKKPAEKPEEISWEEVFSLAGEHMVVSLAFAGIQKLEHKPQGKLYQIWKEQADKALVKEISFDAEREQIFEGFEQTQVKYLPLKGILLKEYYPAPGLRQFSDNDILYEKSKKQDVEKIMVGLGYKTELGAGHHDIYEKAPIYNFELHTQLLPKENSCFFYFDHIWDRAIKDDDNAMGYHMSDEDFYLYHMAHLHKHFSGCGTGLRYFVDQYYLNRKMRVRLDREKLETSLDELHMLDFEKKIYALTEMLFGKEEAEWEHIFDENEEYQDMFLYVMSCGAYGTFSNLVENRMKRAGSKWKYFLSRLTCDEAFLKHDYPVLKKHPWLKPVILVWRLVSAPFRKPEKVKIELQALFGRKKDS